MLKNTFFGLKKDNKYSILLTIWEALEQTRSNRKDKGEYMKAFLILEDGTVFEGKSIGTTRDMISEIVFNTSMTGYLEVLTDPSYAGQAVDDLSTDRKLWNYTRYGVKESMAGWIYCKRIIQNAK